MSAETLSSNSGESEQSFVSTGIEDLANMPDFSEHLKEVEKEKAIEALSEGASTVSVYIEGGGSMSPAELKAKKGEAGAYTPERQAWHEQVLQDAFEAGKKLSEILGHPPVIIAARGGCGSGKTTAFKALLKDSPQAFDDKGDIPGAVKPDYFKDVIKAQAIESLGIGVTSVQAHMESTGICKMYSERLKDDPDTSMLIDKQLESKGDIPDIIKMGKETGKEVKLLDNDVPVELSAFRVLKRPIGGADPNIDFDSVARGFIGIRANRREVLEDIKDGIVSFYSLRAFDPVSKKQIEVIKKENGKIGFSEGLKELGLAVSEQDEVAAKEEAKAAKEQIITEEYIENFVTKFFDDSEGSAKYRDEARKILGAYAGLGITLGEALDSKAAGINPDRDKTTGELIDPSYREKVIAFVQQRRLANSGKTA